MALDTKDRILDAAERLFADRGYASTSLRDITGEAGVNLASVNYHFGSKEALLGAVLQRRLGPVNDRRLQLLDAAEARAGGGPPDLRSLVSAVIEPPFETRKRWGASGAKFLKLVGRIHTEADDNLRATFFAQFDRVFARFVGLAERALPQIDSSELRRRIQCLTGAMAYVMCWSESLAATDAAKRPSALRCAQGGPEPGRGTASSGRPERAEGRVHTDRMVETLIDFGAAGLSAPVRQPVPAEARR